MSQRFLRKWLVNASAEIPDHRWDKGKVVSPLCEVTLTHFLFKVLANKKNGKRKKKFLDCTNTVESNPFECLNIAKMGDLHIRWPLSFIFQPSCLFWCQYCSLSSIIALCVSALTCLTTITQSAGKQEWKISITSWPQLWTMTPAHGPGPSAAKSTSQSF